MNYEQMNYEQMNYEQMNYLHDLQWYVPVTTHLGVVDS
jgi:hypothetical protein